MYTDSSQTDLIQLLLIYFSNLFLGNVTYFNPLIAYGETTFLGESES